MKLNPNTMKLSDNTLTVLKNFAGINNSILVKEGNLSLIHISEPTRPY